MVKWEELTIMPNYEKKFENGKICTFYLLHCVITKYKPYKFALYWP